MRQDITLIGNVFAPGRNDDGTTINVELTNGGFPFEIPADKVFFITHWHLTNKYPYQPPAYDGHLASMYFLTYAGTVTAHHACDHFDPPYQYLGGSPFRGWIVNGMTEEQWVYAMVQGFLEDLPGSLQYLNGTMDYRGGQKQETRR